MSTTSAVDPGNARGRATRRKLLAAGWTVLDGLRLEQVFEALPARQLAEAAGSTERAVRHHFPDGASFAEALLELPVPAGFFGEGADYGSVAALAELLRGLAPDEVVASVRLAAEANWREVTEADDVISLRRQLLLLSRLGAHPELKDRIRDEYYGRHLPLFAESYRAAIEASGRRLLEPFTLEQFTAALAALSEGLLLQWMADPKRITPQFVTDVSVAVALSLTTAADAAAPSVAELEVAATPSAERIDPAAVHWAIDAHDTIVAAAGSITWSQVADACGVAAAEVRAALPTLRSVAALAFAVHLDPVRGGGIVAHPGASDPRVRDRVVFEVVCQLVRVVRTDPICAAALADERRAPVDPALRDAVPLDAMVARVGGLEVRTARRVVDVALALGLSDRGAQPAELAAAACASGGIELSTDVSSLR